MSTQAQHESWQGIQNHLGARQAEVLEAVERRRPHGATLRELADDLHVDMNQVSGRVCELRSAGRLVEVGRRLNTRSGKAITVYDLPAGQGELFA